MTGNQDGAAALFKDGELIAAAEEERFTGEKHAPGRLPASSIRFCLDFEGISVRDLTEVSFAGATYENFAEILSDFFTFNFGYAPPVTLVDHHIAHAASTYFLSGFDESLILTMDFSGDRTSTMASVGKGDDIKEIYRLNKPNSLGIFYAMLTQYLGFQRDNDEYKVMGLSAYGRPILDLNKVLSCDGDIYTLNTEYLKENVSAKKPSPSRQERIYCRNLSLEKPGRIPGSPGGNPGESGDRNPGTQYWLWKSA